MLLHTLPEEHPARNKPVAGFFHRWFCWNGENTQTPISERDKTWRWWGVSPWKLIPLPQEGKNPMPVSKYTYNELIQMNSIWATEGEWSTDKSEPKYKIGEL